MSKETIHTKWHRVDWSAIDPKTYAIMDRAAKYYVADDVVEIMKRPETYKSINALIEANLLRLPYDPIVIEFQASANFRRFVLLQQKGELFSAHSYFIRLSDESFYVASEDATLEVGTEMMQVNNVLNNQDANAICCAAAMALLFLNTRGLEKQVITPEGLNKARAKKGKPHIPTVTTVRIGTVYDRSGIAHNYGNDGANSGRRMRVHLRAGHTRNQHHGPQNSLIKIVYIPPVLVNYNPGDEMPELPEKIIRL